MPIERDRYPENWPSISLNQKIAANWHCQICDRPCRQPGESKEDFELRLADKAPDWSDLYGYVADDESGEWGYAPLYWGGFVLTVAHLDQDPSNNSAENLRALCSVCHLRHDRRFQVSNRKKKRERRGQIPLF